jgi:outer membrane protein assembly factor BamB
MYIATSQGEVVAMKRRSGAEVWRDTSLKNRGLSAPTVVGDYVVVADLEGYVHFFDRATGVPAGRAKTSGDRVTNPPLAVDGILYVISDKGDVSALHGLPLGTRAAKAEPAPAPVPAAPVPVPDAAASPAPGG